MSPLPRPPRRGGPSPRSRWTVPCLVPAGTRSFLVPCSVGTSTSPPRSASATVIGTSTSKLSPLRRRRIRDPSLTPAGMFTRYFLSSRSRPWPLQVGHGCSITVPEPPQREHGRVIENTPWPCDSTQRQLQTGQPIAEVTASAPVPRHV